MLEKYLVTQCAPTLANLKTASLFRCLCPGCGELDAWRQALGAKGIELTVLFCDGTHALVYVYRPARLAADLARPGASRLLRPYGYTSTEPGPALDQLRRRLALGDGFPHEIGVFLGYPLWDVAGFYPPRRQKLPVRGLLEGLLQRVRSPAHLCPAEKNAPRSTPACGSRAAASPS